MQHWSEMAFFNWNSLHARLNSHYEAWSYKKNKHEKIGDRMVARKIMQSTNQSIMHDVYASFQNKEVEPVEPVQMNIYQSNTCVKDISYGLNLPMTQGFNRNTK